MFYDNQKLLSLMPSSIYTECQQFPRNNKDKWKVFKSGKKKLKHFVVFLFKKGAQTGAWTTCSCVSWWVRRGHRYKIQTFSFKAYLEITLASKGKSGIPKRLWIKSQIMKYFLVPLSQCQLMHLSLSFQKHSLVRGWCGRFERIKGWIPAFFNAS